MAIGSLWPPRRRSPVQASWMLLVPSLFLRRYSALLPQPYQIFFNLWGNGGANWVSEYKNFLQEEEAQWTTVVNQKFKGIPRSYAFVTKGSGILIGANSTPMSNVDPLFGIFILQQEDFCIQLNQVA
jgi:hypothetical protein